MDDLLTQLNGPGGLGGGARSAALTLPGFVHDVCSAIHPLAASSPFFTSLPLEKFGLASVPGADALVMATYTTAQALIATGY